MKSLVLYDSQGGNTEKVATHVHGSLKESGVESVLIKIASELEIDFYEYDLIFIGSPVISWLPTETMIHFVKKTFRAYRDAGEVLPAAPLRKGKFAVPFCTYGGPHLGRDEAVPTTKWFGSFLGHLGYFVLDEWHVVGEFHKKTDSNTKGRLGDIQGRPNENDLKEVENLVKGLLSSIENYTSHFS